MNDPLIIAGAFMTVVGILAIIVTNYMQKHNKAHHNH